jgi:hypothetical protein
MQALAEWFRNGGTMGFFVLLLFVVLLVTGIILFRTARSRKPFAVYLCLALLPLGLGFLGTALGYAEVREAERSTVAELTQEDIEIGRTNSWYTTYLGVTTAIPLLLVGLVGIASRKTRSDRESGAQQRHLGDAE